MKLGVSLGFHGLGLFRVDGAPAASGDELASERGAGAGFVAFLWLIERAVVAALFWLVHRVFGGVHLGGVLFVAKGGGDRIAFLEFDWRWRGLGEGISGPEGWGGGGDGELTEEITTGVHDDMVKVLE